MDIPFDASRWQPTRPPKPGHATPSAEALEQFGQQLAAQTKEIQRLPYDPESWLARAGTLGEMRYPELAFGDAQKAGMLCGQALRKIEGDVEGKWRLGKGRGFWMMETLSEDGKLSANLERPAENEKLGMPLNNAMLKKRLLYLQQAATKAAERHLGSPKTDGIGKFCPRPYPWLSSERLSRGDELVTQINEEFRANARDVLYEASPFCEVRRHAFGDDGAASRDVLGIFAIRDTAKGSTILVDKSRIWGCNGPGKDDDLENLHGGNGCGDPVHPNTPDEDTSLDLRWVRDEAGKGASTALLGCRLLLAAIQDGVADPLDHPLAARLTPTYRSDAEAQSFYREDDFEIPLRALQQFGVDIFANMNFDTWILFTIAAKVENNCCGDVISESLMPLFSLFNHSCEPNVDWIRPRHATPASSDNENDRDENEDYSWFDRQPREQDVDHATIVATALRDIKKGEQLFVEYDSFVHDDMVKVRRERLRKWLMGDCMCARCVREEAAAKVQERRRDSKGEDVILEMRAAWDDGEKGQLPEDQPR